MDASAWDERYRATELVWSAGPNRFLVEQTTGLAPGRALDLACGEGRNAIWLAEQGWEVTGVDFSRVAVAKARDLARARGVTATFLAGDATTWRSPIECQLVVVMYLQLPARPMASALDRAASAVGPGGTLLVVGHDRTNLTDGVGGPQDPDVLLTADEVTAGLAGTGLRVEQAGTVDREVDTDDGPRRAIDTLVRASRPPRP